MERELTPVPGADRFRESTEIVLPCGTLADLREEVEAEFAVTVHAGGRSCRIIGSPVEIRAVERFLSRRGFAHQ
jgi:hypothetical protein